MLRKDTGEPLRVYENSPYTVGDFTASGGVIRRGALMADRPVFLGMTALCEEHHERAALVDTVLESRRGREWQVTLGCLMCQAVQESRFRVSSNGREA